MCNVYVPAAVVLHMCAAATVDGEILDRFSDQMDNEKHMCSWCTVKRRCRIESLRFVMAATYVKSHDTCHADVFEL